MTETTTTRTTISTSAAAPRRTAHVALWVLQVLLAGVYLFSAVGKLSADPVQVAGFSLMGLGVTGMYLVGTAELLGGVALLIPRLAGLSALALVALMIGAVTATAIVVGGVLVAVPAVVGVLVAIVAWGRRRSTVELVALVRGYAQR